MRYFKFPKWLKRLYPDAIWDFHTPHPEDKAGFQKTLYLTFDDGPNPKTTNWLLALLAEYNAKATFFCLGNNVEQHPKLYQQLVNEGHQVGNHSYGHLNGFHTKTKDYINDVKEAAKSIDSNLFRPPYGRLTSSQHKGLKKQGFKTVFWSHISYDFDAGFSSEKRIKKTLDGAKDGGVVVFHDSDKAFPQLKAELPFLLKRWQELGFQFKSIKIA